MSDHTELLARLREMAADTLHQSVADAADIEDAADRIEELEKENERWRAWRGIAHHLAEEACFSDDGECPHYKAALSKEAE